MSDNQQTNPGSPVDLTTPAPDQSLSQVSSDNRPSSSVSADSSITSADSVVVPPHIQSAENLTQSPISTPSANPVSDAIRPDSIDSADSSQVPADLIQQSTDSSIPPITPAEPVSTISADLPAETLVQEGASAKIEEELKVDSPPATVSPTEPPVEDTPPASVPAETSIPDLSPSLSAPTVSPDLSNPTDLNNPPPINVGLPNNDSSQVQSEAPKDTSPIPAPQIDYQSAEIRSEPLGSPAMPSTPPENISPPSQTASFGDLLSGNPSSPSIPFSPPVSPVPSPSAPVSFGDLIQNIKPEDSVIQPPQNPPTPPAPPSIPSPPSISQPTTNNSQPNLFPSPTPDIKDNLVLLRQQAKLKKAQKKQAILQKIIDLVKTRGKINNQEAQKILHFPQSTLTDYFKELVSQGLLKREEKGKATYYHL